MEECITKRFFRQRKSCTTERPAAKSFKENTNCSHFRLDRVSKIFGGLNFRGQFRGLNFEGHFRGINPKRNRWHSSVSFSIMFYWLCFCEGGNHGSFLSI